MDFHGVLGALGVLGVLGVLGALLVTLILVYDLPPPFPPLVLLFPKKPAK